MLRTEWSPVLIPVHSVSSSRFAAIAVATFAMAGCSADVTRFDSPMFGLTESSNRVAAAPTPREGMMAGQTTMLSDAQPDNQGRAYAPPPRNSVAVAALPEPVYRTDAPPTGGAAPDAQRYQPSSQPSYQPGYQSGYQPPYQSSYLTNHQSGAQSPPPPAAAAQGYQPPQSVALPPPAHPVPRPAHSPSPSAGQAPSVRVAARTPAPVVTPVGSGRETIEVQQGDTLYAIAQRHKVSISELMSINALSSPALQPGQKLVVPTNPSATAAAMRRTAPAKPEPTSARAAPVPDPAPPAPQVASGARPAETVIASAPAAETPAESGLNAGGTTHTLKSGESLYAVAVRYKVALLELQRINNITDPRKVRAGAVLKLPAPAGGTRVAAVPVSQPKPQPSQPSPPPAGAPVELTTKPTIINAQPKQVAALDKPASTVSDASPSVQAPVPAALPGAASTPAETPATEAQTGKFRWPVRGKILSGFGPRPDGTQSDGIKLAVPLGTEVHAAESGVVAYAGNELKGYGNLILLRHDNGWITAYAHNDELAVKRGDRVRRGQVIAKAGKTGNVDQPQLHFELRQGSSPVDPIPHMEKL